MGQVRATAERTVAGNPEQVATALADYAGTRGTVLTEEFSEYEVREGGRGAGTVVHWKLAATKKRVRDCLFTVSEPAEHTLVETDANSTTVNTWTVLPAGNGSGGATVRVETSWTSGATGIGAFFERTFAPKTMKRIYDGMLANLAKTIE